MLFRFDNLKMDYVRVDLRPLGMVALLFVCLVVLQSLRPTEVKTKVRYVEAEMIVKIKGIEFSPENLRRYIKLCGIRFSDIVYAQAVLETGGFKSTIFLESNNLFGMRLACSRPTTALSASRGHALYDSWMMSTIDYALFQSAFLRNIKTSEDYLDYLSRNYAEDPSYVSKLRKIISKL